MADEMPIVPKADTIICHTGNIVNWNRLKKRMRQTSTAELTDCMKETLSLWLQGSDRQELQYKTDIHCYNEKFIESISDFAEKRDELKITAKLFLNIMDESLVKEAVQHLIEELGAEFIETVILAVPEAHQTLTDMQPIYRTLEELVTEERVFSIGLADLNKDNLELVYNEATVKPMMNQVNLAHCCVIPPELSDFAKANNIQLLTHNDDLEILPPKLLEELLASSLTVRDSEHWQPSWVLRYSVVIKQRGVIKTKGYIAKATRDIKLRA